MSIVGESGTSNSAVVTVTPLVTISGSVRINGQPLPDSPYAHGSVELVDTGNVPRRIAHTDSSSNYTIATDGLSFGSYKENFQYSGAYPQLNSNTTNLPDEFLLRADNLPIQFAGNSVVQNLAFTTYRLTVHVTDAQGNPVSTQLDVGNVGDSHIPNDDGSGTFTVVSGYVHSSNRTGESGTSSFGLFPGATYNICISNGPIGNFCRTYSFTGDATITISPLPPAPTNLAAASPVQTPLLSWDAVAGATLYNVYRDGDFIGTSLTDSYADNNAPVGQRTYYVTAVNASGESQPSNSIEVTVLAPPPVEVAFGPMADSNVRGGQDNRNYGAGTFMRLQSSGTNRALVRFDQYAILAAVANKNILSAKLRLTITDNANNWGTAGRTIDVHRVLKTWAEGDGTENDRGTGLGTTWACATDNQISNQAKDCSGATEWEMAQPNNPATHPWLETPTATQLITNDQSGVVEFDVTTDIVAFLDNIFNYGWLVKKTNEGQNGQVSFGTKESAFTPQLIITYQP
jgi:hypothetical protein